MPALWQTSLMKKPGGVIRDRIQDLRNDIDDIRRSISIICHDDEDYVLKSQAAQASVRILREKLAELEKELKACEQAQYINAGDLRTYLNKFRLVPRDHVIGEIITDEMELEWVRNTR